MAMNKRARDEEPMPQVIQMLQSPAYRSAVAALGGYEAGETGRVLGVREAFGV